MYCSKSGCERERDNKGEKIWKNSIKNEEEEEDRSFEIRRVEGFRRAERLGKRLIIIERKRRRMTKSSGWERGLFLGVEIFSEIIIKKKNEIRSANREKVLHVTGQVFRNGVVSRGRGFLAEKYLNECTKITGETNREYCREREY